jgi:ElaB/YqjD/DUF883 family membrane-anchored ribosome-binding protein
VPPIISTSFIAISKGSDAELHAEEDKREREKVEVRNEADSLYYSTEKSLKDHGDKISEEEKAKIEQAMRDLKGVMDSGSVDEIKAKTEALQQAAYKLAEEMYKATAGASMSPLFITMLWKQLTQFRLRSDLTPRSYYCYAIGVEKSKRRGL